MVSQEHCFDESRNICPREICLHIQNLLFTKSKGTHLCQPLDIVQRVSLRMLRAIGFAVRSVLGVYCTLPCFCAGGGMEGVRGGLVSGLAFLRPPSCQLVLTATTASLLRWPATRGSTPRGALVEGPILGPGGARRLTVGPGVGGRMVRRWVREGLTARPRRRRLRLEEAGSPAGRP